MAYPPPNAAFISAQPKQYDIQSNFGMYPGERLLYHSEAKSGCCSLGDKHFTSTTDIRYIHRKQECFCCSFCCPKVYSENCIYLQDIAEIREVQNPLNCCDCLCCCRVCLPKRLRIRGSFGYQDIFLKKEELVDFEFMIGEAIGRHKLLIQ